MPFRTRMIAGLALPLLILSTQLYAQAKSAKPDIWEAREVTLTDEDTTTPVNVGIWDSGTDLTLFRGQVFSDITSGGIKSESHSLAYDLKKLPTRGFVLQLDATQAQQYPAMRAQLKGLTDLQFNLDTPDAAALKQRLTASDSAAFSEQLRFYNLYVRGTHVAGIVARGNSAIRMGVGRVTFDWHATPQPPTEELAHRTAAADHAYVDWFDSTEMRVVNISWALSPRSYEYALERNNLGADADERKALATKL